MEICLEWGHFSEVERGKHPLGIWIFIMECKLFLMILWVKTLPLIHEEKARLISQLYPSQSLQITIAFGKCLVSKSSFSGAQYVTLQKYF